MKDKHPKEILEKFLYENKDLEQLENIANEFNIFETLGIERDEYRHSNFLSWLLCPNETHGLDDYFLKKFLKKTCTLSEGETEFSIIEIDTSNFDDTEVFRERFNIDILLKDKENELICGIENKIKSGEGENQLQKYRRKIESEFPDYGKFLIFLTPEGRESSSDEESEYWIPMSYSDIHSLLVNLIQAKENVVAEGTLKLLDHYRKTLERHIMEDSELSKLCEKIYREHKDAIELIDQYKPDRRSEIYEFLKKYIKNDDSLVLDEGSTKAEIIFTTKEIDRVVEKKGNKKWRGTDRILVFHLYNRPESFKLKLMITPGDPEYREKLFSIAKENRSVFNNAKGKLYKKFKTIFASSKWLEKSEREELTFEEIEEKIRERFEKFENQNLPKITKVLKNSLKK